MKKYDQINKDILKSLPNPTKEAYEIKIKIPEFTFLGVKEQPDFANAYCRIKKPQAICISLERYSRIL